MQHIISAAIILSMCLTTIVALNFLEKRPHKTREQLKAEWEQARKDHKASEHLHREYVQATLRELS